MSGGGMGQVGLGGYGYGQAPNEGGVGSHGSVVESLAQTGAGYNPGDQTIADYGGYAAGFNNTMQLEQQLAQQAANQKAPTANFSQANAAQNVQAGYGAQQGALGQQIQGSAKGFAGLAAGHGLSAADYGVPGQVSGNIASAQAAAGANPLAARNAAAMMGTANTNVAAGYGQGVAGTMQGAQQGLTGAYGQAASLYGQQGGQDVSAAQMAAQQAQFNPGLALQQQKLSDATVLGYTNAGVGLQTQEQGMQENALANYDQDALARRGVAQQSQNQVVGAATAAGGALLAAA